MKGRKPGSKKVGGRKKGSKNKITREVREILKDIIQIEILELSKRLDLLTTKERIDVLVKLLPFVIPRNEIKVDTEGKISILELLDEDENENEDL